MTTTKLRIRRKAVSLFALLLTAFALQGASADQVENAGTRDAPTITRLRVNIKNVSDGPLRCLTDDVITTVKKNPSSIRSAFVACTPELNDRMGNWDLDPDAIKVIFSSILANGLAPYGDNSVLEFPAILRQKNLNCLNYTAATAYLLRELEVKNGRLFFLGFDGGKIGNHAQLLYTINHSSLLVDPTVGVVAITDYNSLISGIPITREDVISFYSRKELLPFHDEVMAALISGSYRPSDVLYVVQNIDDYKTIQARAIAMIRKKDVKGLRLMFPTPGVDSLIRHTANAK